ncbi:hypothetical protein GGR55DRAFT_621605 [Xylaria sp. FL0064]|nr:hypothetical protein GGR55DRAFT_621605 [Xylaria sp. FL0064]
MPLLLHTERTSQFGLRPSSTEPFQSSYSPIHQIHRRQQSLPLLRQASLTASQNLVATPTNAVEWKNIVDEVKRKYLARKYRSCSMQCCEILGNLKDTSNIEPLHLIYLHFYAASSFEWCARPLSSSSTYRAELLHNAQTHYAEAEVLIAGMEWNVAERARSPSLITSPDSPSFSASPRVPDLSSTASSSPRTSVFCLDDEPPAKATRKARPKSKKKVSFSSLPQLFEFQPEPYIRPDSPTLGWEDPFFMASSHEVDTPLSMSPKKQSSPASIIKPSCEAKASHTRIMSVAEFESKSSLEPCTRASTPVAAQFSNRSTTNQEYNRERCGTPSNHTFDLESFLQTRTLNRFRGQLSALRDQVRRHRAVVDGLLAAPDEIPIARPQSSLDVLPNTPQSHSFDVKSHVRHESVPNPTSQANSSLRPTLRIQTDMRNDVPPRPLHLRRYKSVSTNLGQERGISSPIYTHSPITPTSAIPASPLSVGGDEKNLQDRIERLRASGWRRKRFDSRRYEALREQALGELEPCR